MNDDIVLLILGIISLVVILMGLLFWRQNYKKNKINAFTIKKIVVMGIFFAISLIQFLIGKYGNVEFLWISFDGITIPIIGFLFGPIEAMIYGIILDTTKTIILGYTWIFYYAIAYPMIGLIFGTVSKMFFKDTNWKYNKFFLVFFFQLFIVLQSILALLIPFFGISFDQEEYSYTQIVIATTITVFFFEIFFFYFIFTKKSKSLYLFSILFMSFIFERTINVYLIRSIGDSFKYGLGWESFYPNFLFSYYRGCYLIPLNTIITYFLFKTTLVAMKQTSSLKDFGVQKVWWNNFFDEINHKNNSVLNDDIY